MYSLFHVNYSTPNSQDLRSNIFLICLVLEIIIGWNYADECPVHWRIPHYLVVAGTVGLIGVALIIVQNLLTLHFSSKPNNPSFIFVCGSLGLTAVCIFLFLFSIGWFIAGCIWVFRVWNKVQYQTRKRSDYCHSTLYRFAFWLLFFTICCILLLGYRIINQIRQRINDRKKGPAIPVPTVEV